MAALRALHGSDERGGDPAGERGTVAVMAALVMMALVGMLALVIDIGYAYGQRRMAQNVADSGAVAATQVVAQHLVDADQTDAGVLAAIADVAAHSSGAFSGSSASYGGVYLDGTGASLGVAVGGGTLPGAARGVRLVPAKTFASFFGRVLGVDTLGVAARAAAVARAVTGFDQAHPDYAPYAVWSGEPGYRCADGTYRCIPLGTVVVYRDNDYKAANVSQGNPNWQGVSNNFKGFLHLDDGYLTIAQLIEGQTTQGGNAFGVQPLDMMQAHWAAGTPVVMPIVDRQTGNGSQTWLRVAGFAAVRLIDRPEPASGAGQPPWRGEIVRLSVTYGALVGDAPPTPGVATITAARLVQ